MTDTPPSTPTISSDSTLLLDTIEQNKAYMTDAVYKASLEALGRMRVVQHHTQQAYSHARAENPIPVVFVNDRVGTPGLPFKIEKSVIYTASPLDYLEATLELASSVHDDEDSGLHILFSTNTRIV